MIDQLIKRGKYFLPQEVLHAIHGGIGVIIEKVVGENHSEQAD